MRMTYALVILFKLFLFMLIAPLALLGGVLVGMLMLTIYSVLLFVRVLSYLLSLFLPEHKPA